MSEEPHPLTLPGNGGRILLAILWPGLALLAVIMVASTAMVVGISVASGAGAGDIGKIIGEAHSISRLVALIVIVPVIMMLTLLDKIQGSAAIAALSAIAGYVLGGTAGAP
jgi:hypothetical protein